ncbi:ABC transporter substrate-binding protein [Aureimonas altamirensis]|uniref:ABC transporter substrate-binding protein n=1 Tax=Aureimonas altamirensis TaxID=370622 RepID=UPI00255745F1|nr:ABC transporter substrate-binding protein [Aureimonas altamirensis]
MISRRCLLATGTLLAALAFPVAGQAETTRLTVVFPSPGGLGYYAFYNAIEEGYFAQEGIEVQAQSVNGSAQVIQALLAGQAQIGHPGVAPVLNAREGGEDIVYIYNTFTSSQFNIVVEGDAPYASVQELRGKVIGVGTADGAEVAFARSIFDAQGMKEGEDFRFLTVGEGGMAVAAFMQDSIDAYVSDTAGVATLRLRGVDLKMLTPPEFKAYFGNGYAVTRAFLESNPETIEGFGRALVKGSRFGFAPENREKTLQNALVGNPQQLDDPDFAAALMDTYLDLTAPQDEAQGFGYQRPEAWVRWHDTLVASGDLDKPVDNLEAAYTNAFVPAWNADR